MDNDDLFGELHHVEERGIQEGFTAGVRDGMVAGLTEGRELGLQKGYEIGVEIGFYHGCVQMWRKLQALEARSSAPGSTGSTTNAHSAAGSATEHPTQADAPGNAASTSETSQPCAAPAVQSATATGAGASATSASDTLCPADGSCSDRTCSQTQASPMPNPPQPASQHTHDTLSHPHSQGSETQAVSPARTQPPAAAASPRKGQGTSSSRGLLISERTEKALTGLEELLASFPLDNPQDEGLQELLERVRGRFKAVASSMGLLTDYFPRADAATAPGAAAPGTPGAGQVPAGSLTF